MQKCRLIWGGGVWRLWVQGKEQCRMGHHPITEGHTDPNDPGMFWTGNPGVPEGSSRMT